MLRLKLSARAIFTFLGLGKFFRYAEQALSLLAFCRP